MKKMNRGTYSVVEATNEDSKLFLVRWKDNSVVTTASTNHAAQPTSVVNRWDGKKKQRVPVTCPRAIKFYNATMGGTDRQDQNISLYRISMKGKKFYFPIVTWMIDVSVHNAWRLAVKSGGKHSENQLEFRRAVAQALLQTHGTPMSRPGMRRLQEVDAVSYDGRDHYIQPSGARRHCVHGCGSRPTTECSKCDKGLCINCFKDYHTAR